MTNATIFALATAPVKSGIAIIRISGREATQALSLITSAPCPAPNLIKYSIFYNPISSKIIDKGLAIYFKAPHSFTGEDTVELHLHGSKAVISEILEVLSTISGLRHAEAGEFTRRAFINGKMDLIEAEGLADLIDADTSAQKTQAIRQMQGEMSEFYNNIRSQIINCMALLEAYIDFPDEEIPDSVLDDLQNNIINLRNTVQSVLADHKRGQRLREGLRIVIVGAPNAGKSSLLNMLAGRDAAIVSHHAGTTRDVIEVEMDITGYPVILTDTAGLREAENEIEEEGIKRAHARAGQADIKLAIFDGSKLPDIDDYTRNLLDDNTIIIISKSDLISADSPIPTSLNSPILISTKTEKNIDNLLSIIENKVKDFFESAEQPLITRARHRSLLQEADDLLEKSLQDKPLELVCEELRRAALAISKITGKIQVDDILDVIFREFCIGK
ncbi:MAG: tRNA uridine-5-carboxymethylaminomethyl(34) synthesis GTPase MnmE [Rickettsiales bacterium]